MYLYMYTNMRYMYVSMYICCYTSALICTHIHVYTYMHLYYHIPHNSDPFSPLPRLYTYAYRNTKEKVKVALSVATVKEFIDDQYIPAELVSNRVVYYMIIRVLLYIHYVYDLRVGEACIVYV